MTVFPFLNTVLSHRIQWKPSLIFSCDIHKSRITHEWAFHMKFMKRDFGEFHKFHMK